MLLLLIQVETLKLVLEVLLFWKKFIMDMVMVIMVIMVITDLMDIMDLMDITDITDITDIMDIMDIMDISSLVGEEDIDVLITMKIIIMEILMLKLMPKHIVILMVIDGDGIILMPIHVPMLKLEVKQEDGEETDGEDHRLKQRL